MRPLYPVLFILLVSLTAQTLYGQDINAEKLIRMRDSLDNLLMVNLSTSAILIKKGEVELFSFNNLISNSSFNDKQGNPTAFTGNQVLYNSILQINYGLSRNRRVNLGLDLNYRSYRYDPTGESSLGSVFGNDPLNTNGFTYAGLRLRWQPFKNLHGFNYQANVWFPTASAGLQQSLGSTRVNVGNTFFFYKYFNNKVGLFTQANATLAFPGVNTTTSDKVELYLPISGTLSYVLGRKNIFFGSLSYSWITLDLDKTTEGGDSDFVQTMVGYQRVVTRDFFFMINYSTTIASRNYGEWSGWGLGLRLLL
jgi:hypothetical protein